MRSPFSYLAYAWPQFFPPRPTWSVNDIPDLDGKVVIITGGNGDIGLETAKALLNRNAKVYITVRDMTKGDSALEKLRAETGRDAHCLVMDLAKLSSIKAAAEEFLSKEQRLDILYNNAGIMFPPHSSITPDGFDMTFGTNVLGHFYLTKLLLPVLISTFKISGIRPRVITVSSFAHDFLFFYNVDFESFKDGPGRKWWDPYSLYCQSKFCNILFAKEFARRYKADDIVSISLHPGTINTGLYSHVPRIARYILPAFLATPTQGALTQLRAGTDPAGEGWNGKYMIPYARMGESHPSTDNVELGIKLWEYMEDQVKNIA